MIGSTPSVVEALISESVNKVALRELRVMLRGTQQAALTLELGLCTIHDVGLTTPSRRLHHYSEILSRSSQQVQVAANLQMSQAV